MRLIRKCLNLGKNLKQRQFFIPGTPYTMTAGWTIIESISGSSPDRYVFNGDRPPYPWPGLDPIIGNTRPSCAASGEEVLTKEEEYTSKWENYSIQAAHLTDIE